ncbi:MAG: site-2 protease family protein [Nanoarchaeota archaeon]|nr:site-2 protease family protein [Nanoarchaeota archaeon]
MNFIIFDLILLGLFLIFMILFLIKHKKEIKREGLLFMYRTSWGIKLIHKVGEKYTRLFNVLSHFVVWMGYALMAGMIYLFIRIVWIYISNPEVVRAVKIPPIMPLIPYLPQMFKLNFLPDFYFFHWILILAVIAVSHEFFHGIFAAHGKVKTKTTGLAVLFYFLPIFPAAFVELDEKKMEKISNFKQRAVLAAGTFANVLTALLGVLLMFIFFTLSFSSVGVVYDDYAYNVVEINSIESINGVPINWNNTDFSYLENSGEFNEIIVNGTNYLALKAYSAKSGAVALYYNSPAINYDLTGAILKINNEGIDSIEKLSSEMEKYSVGEIVELTLFEGEEERKQEIILGENPEGEGAWLGITFLDKTPTGFMSKFSHFFSKYKDANVYYEPNFEFAQYIYDFLWWLVLISFSVALVNMLPMGIFDGGRFFYLTILAITKKKKFAEKSFKWLTKFFLFLLLAIMIFYVWSMFGF